MRDFLRSIPVLAGRLDRFDATTAPASPLEWLRDWLAEAVAAGQPEAHAMTLSSVDAEGHPDARVLIAKDIDDRAVYFAGSAASRKGQQLSAVPHAALTFYWPLLGRQVRLRGAVVRSDSAVAGADFRSRSLNARSVALIGRQSRRLAEPRELDSQLAGAAAQLTRHPELVPEGWTVFGVEPQVVEFFQAQANRAHQRLQFTRLADSWTKQLLWP